MFCCIPSLFIIPRGILKLSTGQGVANFILPLWRKIFPEKYLSQDLRLEIEAEKAPDRVSEGPGEEPREREREIQRGATFTFRRSRKLLDPAPARLPGTHKRNL